MKILAVVLVLLCSCQTLGHVSLVTAEASLYADWRSTHAAAESGWVNFHENNPILGMQPSPAAVDVYMISAGATMLALYPVIPKYIRPFVYFGITAAEIYTVQGNMAAGAPW